MGWGRERDGANEIKTNPHPGHAFRLWKITKNEEQIKTREKNAHKVGAAGERGLVRREDAVVHHRDGAAVVHRADGPGFAEAEVEPLRVARGPVHQRRDRVPEHGGAWRSSQVVH